MQKIFFLAAFITLCACQNHIDKKVDGLELTNNYLILKNVDIFNGKDSVLIRNKDVLIENGQITNIKDVIDAAGGAWKSIDCKGKTLMPGLIDAHVHLSGSGCVAWDKVPADIAYNLSAYLYAGITTVYDLGGLAGDLGKVQQDVKNHHILGPDIYHTHIPITVKNSHPIPLTEEMLPFPLKSMVNTISPTINKVEEADKVIGNYVKQGVDYVKIICDQIPPGSPEMSYNQLKALIDVAHKRNKKVFVHIGSPENAVNAVKAGADVLAHGVWRGKLKPEQADIIAKANIPVIYTLAGFHNVKAIYNGTFEPSQHDHNLVPKNILDPVTGENGKDVRDQKIMNLFFKDVDTQSPFWLANFKMLYERGVPILVGTDSNLPGTYAGSTYFQELNTLSEFGMSNYDILKGATYLNSKIFIDNPDFGTIAIGKQANMLLLNGNPLEDLNWIEAPEYIFLNGQIVIKRE